MHIEHSILVAAHPGAIFRIYQDVERWHTWDPDTRRAHLNGPLQVGAKGRLTPTKGFSVPMLVTAVEHNRLFTVESKIPFFCMVFEHELLPTPHGTTVVHRVTLSGPLTMVLGPGLGKQINAGLPVTLSRLKDAAERTSPA